MEILNNFASIYCYIAFVIGAVLMLVSLSIAAMGKDNEPRNKVRFFVTRDNDDAFNDAFRNPPVLWVGVPKKDSVRWNVTETAKPIAFSEEGFKHCGLNYEDFFNMKEGEIREVFINLED